MRKRIIAPVQHDQGWLNVEGLAEVEITSEDAAHPIESALLPGRASGSRAGWRAFEAPARGPPAQAAYSHRP